MNEKERQEMDRLKSLEDKQKIRNRKNNDIIARNFDRVSVAFPKGTKERINGTGKSLNAFIISAVLEKLEKENN